MINIGPRGGKYYLTASGKKQYLKYENENINSSLFCGPAGGYPKGTYPVNTPKRCSAALRYARHVPNPCGIAYCVKEKCPKNIGNNSQLYKKCNIKN